MTTFKEKYNLSDNDMTLLWEMFIEFGMTKGEAPHRSKGNHYFLQAIGQYNTLEWHCLKDKLTPFVATVIRKLYPQLMVTDKSFEK